VPDRPDRYTAELYYSSKSYAYADTEAHSETDFTYATASRIRPEAHARDY
jgi:hypothetical protein